MMVLFERGEFSAADTARAAPALACLSIGLPAYVGVKIFSSAYWSQQDTKTPVKIAASMAIVNIAVALVLTRFMDVAGIALATGMAGWVQCYFLWRGLKGNDATTFDERLKKTVPKIVACSLLMGVSILGISWVLNPWFEGSFWQQIFALIILVSGGGIVYFIASHFAGVLRFGDLKKYFTRRRKVTPLEATTVKEDEL
jgi:putative peptidoglycan lipid II flippase